MRRQYPPPRWATNMTVPDYRTGQSPRTSIACDAARRVTRGAAYLFPPGFFAVVGFFVGRFVAGVFFGLLAFRVTLGGAFAVFTAGFIAFAIGIAPGFEVSKSVQLLYTLIVLSTYLHVA